MDTITCYVKQKNGKSKKYKSRNGQNFQGKDGETYNAPNAENREILDLDTFWGRKQIAFYMEGHQNPTPLSKKGTWKETTNHDSDLDILIRVTKAALMEANLADLKANISAGGVVAILLALLFHHFSG